MLSGTVTAAASLLHTTQPSVSRILAQVQSACGLELFRRQGGRLLATDEAWQLFETVENHYVGLAKIEQDLSLLRKRSGESLRLGCTSAIGLKIVPEVVRSFTQTNPAVELSITTAATTVLYEQLKKCALDLILTTGSIPSSSVSAKILHSSDRVCVLSNTHELASKPEVHVGDLYGQTLLMLGEGDSEHTLMRQLLDSHAVEPRKMIQVSYSNVICMMAAAGVGVGIVNRYVADVFTHTLKIVPFKPALTTHVSVEYRVSALSRTGRAFVKELEDYFVANGAYGSTAPHASGEQATLSDLPGH
jgi:DNA-binding transcriptional LysR family regulator